MLFDQNLSRRLVALLADDFPGSAHVALVGLDRADDRDVWEYARANDYVLVSKDGDFRQLAFLYGAPPKVVSLQIGNSPTSAAVAILKEAHVTIEEFVVASEETLLVLSART